MSSPPSCSTACATSSWQNASSRRSPGMATPLRPCVLDQRDDLARVRLLVGQVVDRDVRPFAGEGDRRGTPHPGIAAGDQRLAAGSRPDRGSSPRHGPGFGSIRPASPGQGCDCEENGGDGYFAGSIIGAAVGLESGARLRLLVASAAASPPPARPPRCGGTSRCCCCRGSCRFPGLRGCGPPPTTVAGQCSSTAPPRSRLRRPACRGRDRRGHRRRPCRRRPCRRRPPHRQITVTWGKSAPGLEPARKRGAQPATCHPSQPGARP